MRLSRHLPVFLAGGAMMVGSFGCTPEPRQCELDLDRSSGIQVTPKLVASPAAESRPEAKVQVEVTLTASTDVNRTVCGVEVEWIVGPGGGTVSQARSWTQETIGATTEWTLPRATGTVATLTALVAGSNPGLQVTITMEASRPTEMLRNLFNVQDPQAGVAGQQVSFPPSVKVLDQIGNASVGVPLRFDIVGSAGSFGPGAQIVTIQRVTDAKGEATVPVWVLGAGSNVIDAVVDLPGQSISGSPVRFTATGAVVPVPPELTLAAAAGDNQSAMMNTPVGTAPAVRVPIAEVRVLPGVVLTWLVQPQDGGLFPIPPAVTDAQGYAQLGYFVPTVDGPIVLQVRTTDSRVGPQFVNLRLTGTAPPSRPQVARNPLTFPEPQSGVAGQPVGVPPSVKVSFPGGQPAVGVQVRFSVMSGGGSLGLVGGIASYQAPTDIAGVVTVPAWLPGPGINQVDATVGLPGDNFPGSPVQFTANAPVNVGLKLVISAGDNQSANVDSPVPVPPVVRVTDAQGNGVAGIVITWAVTQGTGSFIPEHIPSVTDANGYARLQYFGPTSVGPIRLRASAGTSTTPQFVEFQLTGTPKP